MIFWFAKEKKYNFFAFIFQHCILNETFIFMCDCKQSQNVEKKMSKLKIKSLLVVIFIKLNVNACDNFICFLSVRCGRWKHCNILFVVVWCRKYSNLCFDYSTYFFSEYRIIYIVIEYDVVCLFFHSAICKRQQKKIIIWQIV